MNKVAVYGSLKKGKYNHPLIENCKFLGEAEVSGTLYRVSSYPALVQEGDARYPVEVYELDDRTYQAVKGMEVSAGYYEGTIEFNGEDVIVYYADNDLREYCENNCEVISVY
jgi:gamma-glutamylcyclotransferase (GGCT)/AIG2-like uncharacterized protein YtfP